MLAGRSLDHPQRRRIVGLILEHVGPELTRWADRDDLAGVVPRHAAFVTAQNDEPVLDPHLVPQRKRDLPTIIEMDHRGGPRRAVPSELAQYEINLIEGHGWDAGMLPHTTA
jgi:hypothetical protein